MRATDAEPSRIVAAQNAAKAFLNDLPPSRAVGIVAFLARHRWRSCPYAVA